ncbi:UNVERIFIED_CONTAM: hypothetical protein FKN15_052844 [Acipenser sinensis]
MEFLFQEGDALSCYTCEALSSTECKQTCSTGDTCMTVVATVAGVEGVSKSCTTKATCDAANAASFIVSTALTSAKVTCCSTNLCNASTAPARLNRLLLGASVALLVLLRKVAA